MEPSRIRGHITLFRDTFGFIKPQGQEYSGDCYFNKWDLDISSYDLDHVCEGTEVEFYIEPNTNAIYSNPYKARRIKLIQKILPSIGAFTSRGGDHDFNEDEFFTAEVLNGSRIVAAIADGLSNPSDTGWWSSSEVITFFMMEVYKSQFLNDETPLNANSELRKQQLQSILNDVQSKFKDRQREMTDNRRQAQVYIDCCCVRCRLFY